MPYTTYGKNLMLGAVQAKTITVGLHSADPGTTGANELSGGSPAYARKTIAFAAPSGGVLDDSTNGLSFDVPAGSTVAWVTYWDGMNLVATSQVATETYNQQGTHTITDAKLDLNLA